MKQLVMMKHSSVFINDAAEAGRLIKEMPSKGSIYGAFRYDVTVPDMLGEFDNGDFYKSSCELRLQHTKSKQCAS